MTLTRSIRGYIAQKNILHEYNQKRIIPFSGFYHHPAYPSFEQFVQMIMATENTVRIIYEPETNSPRELVFRASTAQFQKAASSEHLSDIATDSEGIVRLSLKPKLLNFRDVL